MVSIKNLQQLREETGISMMECKKALEEANDNVQRAKEILREKGTKMIKDKEGRNAGEGIVSCYIHPGAKIGVLLELRCETDFVARSKEFQQLAHELCLHIAAMKPKFVKPEDIPSEIIEKEKRVYQKQFENSGKPPEIIERIVASKLKNFKEEVSLIHQPWVKDTSRTISDLINSYITKLGEKIEVTRFVRYEI